MRIPPICLSLRVHFEQGRTVPTPAPHSLMLFAVPGLDHASKS